PQRGPPPASGRSLRPARPPRRRSGRPGRWRRATSPHQCSACSCPSVLLGHGEPGSLQRNTGVAQVPVTLGGKVTVPGRSRYAREPVRQGVLPVADVDGAGRSLNLLRRRCVHQSSKLSVCKHLVFLAATRPVQSLQSSHVFYGVDLATPSQPPRRGLVNPNRKMWPRSHRPPSALHPGSVKV